MQFSDVDHDGPSRVRSGHRRVRSIALVPIVSVVALGACLAGRARAEGAGEALPASEHDESSHRLAHIGVLGGFGFPRPLAIEGIVGVGDRVALGLEYSVLPTTTIYDVETRFHALAVDARVFPFGGAFFIGARAGRQHLAGSSTLTVQQLGTASGSLAVDTWFINPRLGFLWMWQSGFAVGFDAGLQIPVASNLSTTVPSGLEIDSRVTSIANSLGRRVVPTVDLLRIGLVL